MYDEELFLERYNADNWDIWSQLDEVLWLWKDTYREYWGIDRRSPPEGLTEAQWKDARVPWMEIPKFTSYTLTAAI